MDARSAHSKESRSNGNDAPLLVADASESDCLLRRQVNDDKTVGTSLSSVGDGGFLSVMQQGVVVSLVEEAADDRSAQEPNEKDVEACRRRRGLTHEHDGDSETLSSGLGDLLEAELVRNFVLESDLSMSEPVRRRGARSQREATSTKSLETDVVRVLDGRSVCDRVAEGNTELDDVGASLLEGEQERDGRVPGGEAGGEERNEDRVVLLLALFEEIAKLLRHGERWGGR